MPRLTTIRIIFLAIAAMLMAVPACAHSPYFTQREKLVLPDGRMGEIRLLHGDGIFLADPVRAMVFDDQGRPLARSSWSGAMTIACDGAHRCRVYELGRMMRHDPDPAAFRIEAAFDLANEDFGPVKGREGYGFAVRRMTLSDLLFGHAVYIWNERYSAAIVVAASAFATMLILIACRRTPRGRAARTALYYFCMAVVAVLIAPVLALVSIAILIFGGMPILLWLSLSVAGVIVSGLLFRLLTRVPSAVATA